MSHRPDDHEVDYEERRHNDDAPAPAPAPAEEEPDDTAPTFAEHVRYVVHVRGLPWAVTRGDVARFLAPAEVVEGGVVLGFAGGVRIEAPAALREEHQERLQEALAVYPQA